jgi:hypothetical protein
VAGGSVNGGAGEAIGKVAAPFQRALPGPARKGTVGGQGFRRRWRASKLRTRVGRVTCGCALGLPALPPDELQANTLTLTGCKHVAADVADLVVA